jgi:hypothetical protein
MMMSSQLEERPKWFGGELGGEIVQLNFNGISFSTEEKKLRNMRFFGDHLLT